MNDFVKGTTLLRRKFVVGSAVARVISMRILEREVLANVDEIIRVQSLFVVSVVCACATDR